MSGRRNRSGDMISRRPGRGYKIFVFAMAGFLVLGSVALIVGSAFDGGGDIKELSEEDRPGEEISRLETVVAENPQDTESMAVLANILANSGRVEEAIPWYERAVNANPDNGDLRLAFGLALFQLGNDFDAEIQLKRAQELMPDSASPSYYLGQLYERQPDPDLEAAREQYERAVEIAPDSFVGEQAQARLDELDQADVTPTP